MRAILLVSVALIGIVLAASYATAGSICQTFCRTDLNGQQVCTTYCY